MSTWDRAQKETILRIAVSNIRIIQDNLRKLPIIGDDPTADGMVSALHALDAAIFNLRAYATNGALTIGDSMPT